MLFAEKHGQRFVLPTDGAATESGSTPGGTRNLSEVAPGAKLGDIASRGTEAGLSGTDAQSFGYMMPEADGMTGSDVTAALKALAEAMTEAADDPVAAASSIPPLFTYFGQFIDHDITANTDRDAPQPNPISEMTGPIVEPLDRSEVVSNIVNLRNGSLRLDSLYGEGPSHTPFTIKTRNALRDPDDRAKMRLGGLAPVGGDLDLPADGMADLPRLGDMIDDPASGLDLADLEALPDDDFKKGFVDGGVVKRSRAMIGDGRNDENLLVAQLHLSFLRFHNAIADGLKTDIPDDDARFQEAKRRTTLTYQWLVVNQYLPRICQPSVVDAVKAAAAPMYAEFRDRVGATADELPLPLEFSVAALRFGHSMVRAAYDHNKNFGRPAGGGDRRASFMELFSFTGGDRLGETAIGIAFDQLPSNWPIDWTRFAKDAPDQPDHVARKIDTQLAPPLTDMFKESDDAGELGRILRFLAERNLRRSHRMNIPSGQGMVAAVNAFDAADGPSVEAAAHKVAYVPDCGGQMPNPDQPADGIDVLSPDVLGSGPAGGALASGGMTEKTPLWYYILREAEVTQGDTLGPLGSRLVAETLVGLIIQDDQSYWNEGSGNGSWTPADVAIGGNAITDFPKMLTMAGLMA
jgi:hypothetical protein